MVEGLYRDVERRIAASPPGLCPVEMSLSFLQLCHAQTCGKCVPCRIGLGQLTKLISQVLDGTANMDTVRIIEKTARSIVDTADCAIGRDAARLVVDGLEGFRDDYEEHVQHHRCLASLQNPVPCVALCPAGVDIPGYMALVGVGRYADAVRLIRKDNPMPTACAYICEHPCEARCRRNMIDDPINIRGLKRYAVDHAGVVPNPPCAPATGKTVAIVGGGPSGLSCAYYLALMGHKVTIFEECSKLGGMLRYGIPSYRFPREKLDAEIDSILSLGIEVRTNVRIGRDIWLEELEKQYDCIYIAIGAHQDKKTGIPGEDSCNVISAVEMLKAIGDDVMPDFTGKQVVVIGGGNVAMDVTRSSIRLGASKVTCVYRRRLEDMTALPVRKIEKKLTKLYTLRKRFEEKGVVHEVKTLQFEVISPSDDIREKLEIIENEDVYKLIRCFYADHIPYAIEISYVPTGPYPDLSANDIEKQGLYKSMQMYNIIPEHASENIFAVKLTNEDALILGLKPQDIAIQIERTTHSNNRIIEFTTSLIKTEYFYYTSELSST